MDVPAFWELMVAAVMAANEQSPMDRGDGEASLTVEQL